MKNVVADSVQSLTKVCLGRATYTCWSLQQDVCRCRQGQQEAKEAADLAQVDTIATTSFSSSRFKKREAVFFIYKVFSKNKKERGHKTVAKG